MLFDTAVVPFLWALVASLVCRGIVRACADDIASSISQLTDLNLLLPIFRVASSAAGLQLNLKKCVLIPAAIPLTAHIKELIGVWLARWIPEWASFAVDSSGELLGVYIGPTAAAKRWLKPCRKFFAAVGKIASASFPPSLSVIAYNTFAASTCSFLAQVSEIPAVLLRVERHAVCKILKLPGSTFTTSMAANLHYLGLPRASSLKALGISCATRAASRTFRNWRVSLKQLSNFSGHLSLAESQAPAWPAFWDNASIASFLDSTLRSKFANLDGVCAVRSSSDPLRFQARIYEAVLPTVFPISWPSELFRRFKLFVKNPGPSKPWPEYFELARDVLTSYGFFLWIRIPLNAWNTSARHHSEEISTCVFGCEACDDLAHYLMCPILPQVLAKRNSVFFGNDILYLLFFEGRSSEYHSLLIGHLCAADFGALLCGRARLPECLWSIVAGQDHKKPGKRSNCKNRFPKIQADSFTEVPKLLSSICPLCSIQLFFRHLFSTLQIRPY